MTFSYAKSLAYENRFGFHLSNLFQGRLGEVAQNRATSYRHGHSHDSHRYRARVCTFVKAVTIRYPCPCFILSLIFTARYLIESFLCQTAQVVDSLFFMRDYRIFYKMIHMSRTCITLGYRPKWAFPCLWPIHLGRTQFIFGLCAQARYMQALRLQSGFGLASDKVINILAVAIQTCAF